MTTWTSTSGKTWLKAGYFPGDTESKGYDFEAVDAKGRRIGVRHAVRPVEIKDIGEEGGCLWEVERGYGLYFCAYVHMTKNGKDYGASQPRHHFKTEEEVQKFFSEDLAKRIKKHGAIVAGL